MSALDPVEIRVFSDEDSAGVPQYLVECSNLEVLKSVHEEFSVQSEFDYTFFFQDSDNELHARWKNKKGSFQLCGSGAYALCIHVFQRAQIDELTINTGYTRIKGRKGSTVELALEQKGSSLIQSNEAGDLYFNQKTGIHLLQVKDDNLLNCKKTLFSLIDSIESDIHGYCVFYWDKNKAFGKLRYFVPWHGREEDYVTGSLHEILSPLVYRKYGSKIQRWKQTSSLPGSLNTRIENEKVIISEV